MRYIGYKKNNECDVKRSRLMEDIWFSTKLYVKPIIDELPSTSGYLHLQPCCQLHLPATS